MEKRRLGKTDLLVTSIGFGGAEIGFSSTSKQDAARLLNDALASGINVIDTAAAYLESERLIGQAVSHRRSEYCLMTKCGALDGFSRSDWSKAGILRSAEASLKNLRTDHLDVLFLHSCAILEMLWAEALVGVEAAREKGYARYIGYSGDGPAALWAIQSGRFDVVEMSLNIADQEAIDLLLPEAMRTGIGVIAKRPIANAAWRYKESPKNDYHVEYWKRLQALAYPFLAQRNAAETALRFTLSQRGVHCAIVGTLNPERFAENLAAAALGPLAPDEVAEIRALWANTAERNWTGQV